MKNPFRYRIVFGPKKRGLWRPSLKLEWWLEWGEKGNSLNISTTTPLLYPPDGEWGDVYDCNSCAGCTAVVKSWLEISYYRSASQRNERDTAYCRMAKFLNGEKTKIEVWPEWPAPFDIPQWWVSKFFKPVSEKFQERVAEAYKSEPLPKRVITDLDVQDAQTPVSSKEKKKQPKRKIKIK